MLIQEKLVDDMSLKDWQLVLDFWFGDEQDTTKCVQKMAGMWWGKDDAVDTQIRQQFGCFLNGLKSDGYREWLTAPSGRLAAIIVVDQFSRNIYRDTPQAFEADHLALQWCLDGINIGDDLELRPIERVFFYMPLEHSESMEMQQLSLFNYKALLSAEPKSPDSPFVGFLEFAQQHGDVIERFGRYPHRNKILGRESTPEELEFFQKRGGF